MQWDDVKHFEDIFMMAVELKSALIFKHRLGTLSVHCQRVNVFENISVYFFEEI